jgi:RNA polymerase sigma factor (sigma-70 family)
VTPQPGTEVDDVLRRVAPQALGTLVRRHASFVDCEDALQEALVTATAVWPERGVPRHPHGWLVTVASRRLTEAVRRDQARARRERMALALAPPDLLVAVGPDERRISEVDDTLKLLLLCCDPVLSPTSQLALTLRVVAGLTTGEISRAFLVPETTMAQRISRAKQRLRTQGAPFAPMPPAEQAARLPVVRHVLYLMFTEGHTSTNGSLLQRHDLTRGAIGLARTLHRLLPDDGETMGLLALMLLTDARRPARTDPDGTLIPLAEQDRRLWDRETIDEGTKLVTTALARHPVGPYQLQAAIAAVHAEATRAEDTDWPQIRCLYYLLEEVAPGPMVRLNHGVAVAMVHGPRAGLEMLADIDPRSLGSGRYRLDAVRGHMLEMAGDRGTARAAYQAAARGTLSLPERRYLERRANRLAP